MEATLLHLIFYITAFLLTKVAEDFGEHPFQCVVANGTARGAFGVLHCYIAVVAKVEGGAIEVATVLGGIHVRSEEHTSELQSRP